MKVLFCAYDRPGHLATGPNAWLQRLVPDLRQHYGLDIHTLFIFNGLLEDCPTINYFKEKEMSVSLINKETQPYVADQVKSLLQIVKAQNIEIVVANLVIPALYATCYLKRANIPVIGVLHSHDLFYKGVIKKFVQGNIKDQLTAIVAVSHFISKLAANITSTTRHEIIPCGTPIPLVKANWENPAELKVMYAGRIVIEAKQILKLTQAFLEAAALQPKLQFSIYGDGEEVEKVQNLLTTPDNNKVVYKGAVSPSDIIACFQEHQIFTLMSDYEGMPIALMEAMACGLVPVCLEEASGINEIIDHGVNGFIVKDRGADYQKHLKLLIDNTELWVTMSKNAVQTIAQRYSTDITHKKWHDLLKSFAMQKVKPVNIPNSICLQGALLHYGDNRKPTQSETLQKNFNDQWMRLRLFIRPRARIRALLKKRNSEVKY